MLPKVNKFAGDVNDGIDATEETAGSDNRAEKPAIILVLAPALSESRAFGIESTAPGTVVELQRKRAFSKLIIVALHHT